jgi:hypothetical protein
MNSQTPNSLFVPVKIPASQIENPKSKIQNLPSHFWRTEPAPHVDPALLKRSPWYAVQHVFCRRDTGELVGIIRRLPSQFKTAWFSGNGVTVKRHYSFQAAKKFLERQFTRTIPRCPVLTLQRFNALTLPLPVLPAPRHSPLCNEVVAVAPRPAAIHRKDVHVDFSRSPKSKIEIRNSKITSSLLTWHTPPDASPNRH